jgi:hypothetical protein
MEDSLWYESNDPTLWEAIRRVWDFADRTVTPRFPPGVHKHRSIDEAQATREVWEERNFRAYWERQVNAGTVRQPERRAAHVKASG